MKTYHSVCIRSDIATIPDDIVGGFKILFNRIVYIGHYHDNKDVRKMVAQDLQGVIYAIPFDDLNKFKEHVDKIYAAQNINDFDFIPLKEFSKYALKEVNNEPEIEIATI